MAYVKQTWATGDVVTATKLNNMESGIVSKDIMAVIPIDVTSSTTTVNYTYDDLVAAYDSGSTIYLRILQANQPVEYSVLTSLEGDNGIYNAKFSFAKHELYATAGNVPMSYSSS